MTRIQVIVVVGFALAFAAGGSVGMLVRPGGAGEPRRRPSSRRHLAKELNLTSQQQEQMRTIWSEVMGRQDWQQARQRMLALQRQRTEAIEALLTEEQRARYKQILAEHARAVEKMGQERHRLVEEAVERTKKILSEEQAKKYEEMRKTWRRGAGPGAGRRGSPRTRRAPDGAEGVGPGPFGRPGHLDGSHPDRPTQQEATSPP